MVDWSSSLDLVSAVFNVSEHTLGFGLFRLLYGLLLGLFMLGYASIRSAVWGDEAIWERSGFAAHRLRPFGLFDIWPERTAGIAAIALGLASAILLVFSRLPAGYLFVPISHLLSRRSHSLA